MVIISSFKKILFFLNRKTLKTCFFIYLEIYVFAYKYTYTVSESDEVRISMKGDALQQGSPRLTGDLFRNDCTKVLELVVRAVWNIQYFINYRN